MNLIKMIEERRIALIPEYHAEVYGDEDVVQYRGYGAIIDESITDAFSPVEEVERVL